MGSTDVAAPPQASPPSPPRRPGAWQAVQPVLARLHFYAGILIGPFLVVAASTGLLYTLAPTIERVLHADILTVEQVGTDRTSLADQVASLRDAGFTDPVVSVAVAGDPELTTRVVTAPDDVPVGATRTVFVDPYTATVVGDSVTYDDWLPEREWIETFHSSLHLGTFGLYYSELAASWLWVVALGGLAMWVTRTVRRRRLRRLVVPERGRPGLRRTLSWHGSVGTLVVAGLLILSVTGLTWSTMAGAKLGELRMAVTPESPSLDRSLGADDGGSGGYVAHHHGGSGGAAGDPLLVEWNRAEGAAVDAGIDPPYVASPPFAPGQAWTVTQTTTTWPMANDAIAVDPATGFVDDRLDFEDKPLLAKITDWGIYFHLGMLFGPANVVFLAVTAAGLVVLTLLGYRMWWQRRPPRVIGHRPGPLPQRGALRAVPWWATALIVAGALVAGWYVPLFGYPLAVFVVVDVLVGLARRRRPVATPASGTPSSLG
ncbi:PepSY-associated TM helix domain-containing protein [Paraoerskovia marina]|uniref:PepSY-associated TM helix domain-containing protein n=1 Tax=Paraoerskovia marina TaxID=545619 RepID=UPI0006950116|nr:PepSY-associated TM helix domain-containing protein [Paraoerskovia marina]